MDSARQAHNNVNQRMKLSFDLSSASVPAELKVYLEARKPLTAVLQSLATFGSKLPDLEMRLGSELMNAPARTRSHTGKRLTIDDNSELGILILSLHRRLRLSCSHVFELLSVIYWKSSQPPAALGPQAAPEPRAVPPSLPTSSPPPLLLPAHPPPPAPQQQSSLQPQHLAAPFLPLLAPVSGEPHLAALSDILLEFKGSDFDFLKDM
jgi:hypothetical protein